MSEDATLDGFTDSETELLHSEPEGVRLVLGESYPKEWRFAELEDVCVVNSGFTWDKEQETDSEEDGAVPVIKIGNVQDGYLDLTDVLYLKGVSDEELQKNKARKNWLLMIGSNGSGERVGHCGIIEDNMEFVYASFLYGLNADSERVIPRYLFYLLNRPKVQQRLTSFTAGSTSLKNLNKYTIENISLPTPPLSEQRKIATVLHNVDQAIQKTEEIIEQYERIIHALQQTLIKDGLNPEESGQSTPTGRYPSSWPVVRAGEYIKLRNGEFLSKDDRGESGQYPVYGGNGIMGYTDETTVGEDTLVIGRVGAYCGNIHITESNAWVTDNAIVVNKLSDEYSPRFLAHLLDEIGLGQFSEQSAQPRISQSTVENLRIPKPPIEQQLDIVEKLDSVEKGKKTEKQYQSRLKRLKQGLMQDLLSGTIRTTDTNIEVPDKIAQHG